MDTFFAEHGGFAAALVSVLLAGWVALGTAYLREKFRHIDGHQERQDTRLEELEDDVGSLKGGKIEVAGEVRNLSKLLEKYFEEMKERADRYEASNDGAHNEIKKEQKEIKGLLRQVANG